MSIGPLFKIREIWIWWFVFLFIIIIQFIKSYNFFYRFKNFRDNFREKFEISNFLNFRTWSNLFSKKVWKFQLSTFFWNLRKNAKFKSAFWNCVKKFRKKFELWNFFRNSERSLKFRVFFQNSEKSSKFRKKFELSNFFENSVRALKLKIIENLEFFWPVWIFALLLKI